MHTKILGLLTAMVMAMPMAASAQETTLDYQGYVMGGTSTTYIGPEPPPLAGVLPFSQLVSAPVSTTATIDATLTYSGSLAQNDLVIDSYEVNLTANNGQTFSLLNILQGFGGPLTLDGTSACYGGPQSVCITLTASGNTVTGASIELRQTFSKPEDFDLSIGPNGDSFSYSTYGIGSDSILAGTDCRNPGGVTFVGPARASPCTMDVSNPTAGLWTVAAPEINPNSAPSALTLLLGGLVALRGRRTASLAT
jgi:hypothetical protein